MIDNVLITGGSGSFGRACVRKLLETGATRVCVYSRGEHTQAAMADEFKNDLSRLRFFVGDVRDRDRLRRAMDGVGVVIHAAALKRIEVGAYCPSEMIRTNIEGAMNVIEAARDADMGTEPVPRKVVFLSSDKAFQPCSPYGQTKALAEALFLSANASTGRYGPLFAVTRYGNVAGTNGSVIPKWRAQIAAGQAITMTDPDCTRFYMTVDQAVALVLDTVRDMKGGELAIPSLPAYRLGDLAEAMGAKNVVATGLPAFEKMHESMADGNCSKDARRMSVAELKEELSGVEPI